MRRVEILFAPADRDAAKALLYERCGNNLPFQQKADQYQLERFRFAALKYSDGDFSRLEQAVELAQVDWRDLLMAVGFAVDIYAHRKWEPKPAAEPPEIDAPRLATSIQDRLATVLYPLGFERQGSEWRRAGEVPQSLLLIQGLTSRIETRFFLRVQLESKPVGVTLQLPRLPSGPGMLSSEQGYIFRAGDDEAALCTTVMTDFSRTALPLFERFTALAEVQRGFDDGTFKPHLRVEDQALIF
jgi:hypothetical protein